MDLETIAVIGAGNGGFALAADLAMNGWRINLYELPRFGENIIPLKEKSGINITGVANIGFARFNKITTDMAAAVEDASIVLVNTVALAHEEIAVLLAPHLKDGQGIFIIPGSGGSFVFKKVFAEAGIGAEVFIAETYTLPYGCRKTDSTTVNVSRLLGDPLLAALPSRDNEKALEKYRRLYPESLLMTNALEVAICNPNIILHPAATMLSISRIEHTGGDFGLYQEGFSPSVMEILDALDRECLRVQKGLGLPGSSFKGLFEKRYHRGFDEQFSAMRKLGSRGPFDVKTRYITEDVPIGMVLVSSIGRWLGIPTPTYDSVIHLCGVMNTTDYWKEGRTLEKLGLSKMSLEELKRFVESGG